MGPGEFKIKGMMEKVIRGKYGAGFGNSAKDSDQPALMFVHGAGGSHLMWLGQLAHFSKAYRPIAINLPGHGLSPGEGCQLIEDYAEFVLGLADELKLDKFILAGLSMGGAISQAIALKAPDRLTGLVLLSTGAKLKVMPELFKLLREDWPAYLKMFPQFAFSKNASPKIIELAVKELAQREPLVVEADFRACDRFNLTEQVKQIKVPCLIISAMQDLLTPPKYMDYLHAQIAGSRLVRIEDAGHIVNLEKPAEVNKSLGEFFEEVVKKRNSD